MAKLLMLGQDLIALKYVEKLPDTIERKTFKRDKLISNSFSFICKNNNNFFSVNHPKSIFYGIAWYGTKIILKDDDNNLIWSGVLINPKANHRTKKCTLVTKDNLYTAKEKFIDYESSTWETAATIAKAIMIQEGFTAYDETAIQKSINILTTNSVLMKVNFNTSSNINLFSALEKLAIHSAADCYSSQGNVFFKVWTSFSGNTSIKMNTDRTNWIKTKPIVNYLEREMINDYELDYDGSSIPVTDSIAGNIGSVSRSKYGIRSLEPMRTGTGKQITFKDLHSAQWTGEQYIKRSHFDYAENPRPLVKIQFDIDIKFKNYITLDTFFKLSLPDENWTDKHFEVFEFRRSESRHNINIIGYEAV